VAWTKATAQKCGKDGPCRELDTGAGAAARNMPEGGGAATRAAWSTETPWPKESELQSRSASWPQNAPRTSRKKRRKKKKSGAQAAKKSRGGEGGEVRILGGRGNRKTRPESTKGDGGNVKKKGHRKKDRTVKREHVNEEPRKSWRKVTDVWKRSWLHPKGGKGVRRGRL